MAHGTRELTNQTERLKDVPKANLNQKKKQQQREDDYESRQHRRYDCSRNSPEEW